jgi:hypothetical protein
MKKDNNAIKRLLKHTNVKDLHGYFKQNDNYILCNSISVIKFDNNNIDFIDDIKQSQSIHYSYDKFNNMFNDIKKAIQDNNNNTIEINIQDLKMWKKHADKSKPFIFKVGNNYAGVNAAYLLDLALLTRQDKNNAVTIQANNNKTPLYIAGNDVSAVLCLIGLKQGYNENDYNLFIDSLAECYTKEKAMQDDKNAKKAAKSTKTIEKETLYKGFTFWIAGKQIFIVSDKKKINDNVTKEFLNAITDVTGINCDNISDNDYKYIKSGINAATLLKTVSYYGNEEIYRIETKYNSENFYKNEYDRLIIYNGNMEKIDICADDMSATDEETPKTATIQDNNADIVADPETTNETTAADVMSATNTDKAATTDTANNDSVTATQDIKTADNMTQGATNNAIASETMQADVRQDKPHKTIKKAMCLFIVTDKPQPVKLSAVNIPTLERIPTYTQRIISRLQPLKSHKVYNTRVSNKKVLKKAYNDFVGTVSCYNDKCAIGGKVAAGNTS